MSKQVCAADLRCNKRQDLSKIVPLQTPFLLNLEPTNLCNFRCKFCPTGHPDLLKKVGRVPQQMSLEFFKEVVNQLKTFPQKIKVVNLYKDGEPLLHRDFPEMYHFLLQAGVAERIIVKTNAALLTPDLSRRLIDAGIKQLDISIESVSSDGYKKISDVNIDYEELKNNIRFFYKNKKECRLYIKIIDVRLTKEDKEKFVSDFGPICDEYAIESVTGWSYSDMEDFTLGLQSDKAFAGDKIVDKTVCPLTLFALAVNSDGTVSICCCDWAHQTVIGNLHNENILDIWNGKRLFDFRMMHLTGNRKNNQACKDCILMKSSPDNVDSSAQIIIQRLQKSESK